MSQFKTRHDCYCFGCPQTSWPTTCFQPQDWNKGRKARERWFCAKCMERVYKVRVYEDKTVWGELFQKDNEVLKK